MVTCLSSSLIKNLRFRNLPMVIQPASGEARLQCAGSGQDFLLKELKEKVNSWLSMQVPTCGCQWSIDVSVSIHPNDTEIWVDPGMARDATNRHTLKEKKFV